MWHPIRYIYDTISTMYDNKTLCVVDTTLGIWVTSFPLHLISHSLYHTKPQYLCHIHFTHEITPTVSDVTPTVSLSSHPLHWYLTHFCMTSYHYMCDIICTLYNIISTAYVVTLLYLWYHSLYIWNHIQYIGPHIHYTGDITATNLCHTLNLLTTSHTLCITSHSGKVWQLLHYKRHHILALWHQATIFMTSHPLYLTSSPLYLCHHIACIDEITATDF